MWFGRPTATAAPTGTDDILGTGIPLLRKLLAVLVLTLPLLPAAASAAGISAVPVATGLNDPTAFTFDDQGRIWYGERTTGTIRILDPGTGSDLVFLKLPHVADEGLVGIALHPNFPARPFLYVYAVRIRHQKLRAQLLRISVVNDAPGSRKLLLSVPAGPLHRGGTILFGPDGMLYVMVGDGGVPANAQDLANPHGKILRMTGSGLVPNDNPESGNLVWASGLRNSIGLDFDPLTGNLWESDNGPECNDEVNRIIRGRNYGWGPHETCTTPPAPPKNTNQDGPSPVMPRAWYGTPIAPTGAAFCSSCGLGAPAEGTLFMGDFNTGSIRDLTLTSTRRGVASEKVVYSESDGIRSLEAGPGGTLYFSDSTTIYRLTS
jgi:glucose/arabinose dehydrogenase